jgi:hypothetical protein
MSGKQNDIIQGGHVTGKFVNSSKPISGGKFSIFVVQEDCVITSMTDVNNADVKAQWNIGSETIKAGTILYAHNQLGIKTVVLASGSGFVLGEKK